MKVLLGILLFLFSSIPVCYSQVMNNDTFQLTKLPAEGILLGKGWKFHAGDDSAWAKPEYNDKDWQTINPSLDIRHIPQLQNVSIGWFRLKLLVDSSLIDQPLGMTISQVGASEIYLDGNLVYRFGKVDSETKKEQTYYLLNRPFSIKLGSKRFQTIAIRYSYNPKGFLIKWGFENFCMRIVLNNIGSTFSTFQKETRLFLIYEMTKVAIWLLLCIFSLGLYISIRSRKEYLLIGIYSLFLFISNVLGGLIARELLNTQAYAYTYFVSRLFYILGLMIALSSVIRLFNQNKNWYYYALMLCSFCAMVSFFVFYDQAALIFLTVFVLYGIEMMRISLKGIRDRRPGAALLFFGSSIVFFFAPAMIFFLTIGNLQAAAFIAFLGEVSVPFWWSLFIAGEFGRTGLALQARVKEVEQLSQKAIAQERDKQIFLESQNEILEKRVEERTALLNKSLKNLQSTQSQLIQSEKMASLGEITAGIAHEIQNPLNFVNNFSEVNTELIDELQSELKSGNAEGALTITIGIRDNEQKIVHHGRRADAIVKSMLQHNRSSSGIKEPTDINALVDEYLRLSYRGMRTKDNSLNVTIQTEFDDRIGNINLIPQDIGRVLLNLFNNAFYALSEKKRLLDGNFEPIISVITRKLDDRIEIRVKDNGNGIPQKHLDKIFQPFFTTKPTGQGTGLGLSLSYDIIKAHAWELNVDTKEEEGSEFIIQIPMA